MNKKDFAENLFALNFAGQELEIMIDLYHKIEQSNGEDTLVQQNPLAMRGFLLDMDDEYIYLGDTPNGINKFVRRDKIVGGDIVKDNQEQTVFDEILNNFDTKGNAN